MEPLTEELQRLLQHYTHATGPSKLQSAVMAERLERELSAGWSRSLFRSRRAVGWTLAVAVVFLGAGAGAMWRFGALPTTDADSVVPAASVVDSAKPLRPMAAPEAPEVEPVVSSEPPVSNSTKPARAAPRPQVRPEASVREAAPDISEELMLIGAARSAVRAGRITEAQALLAEHEKRYPTSAFAEERAGLRTVAACRLGNGSTFAKRFLQRYPHSPLVELVTQSCSVSAAEGKDAMASERLHEPVKQQIGVDQ